MKPIFYFLPPLFLAVSCASQSHQTSNVKTHSSVTIKTEEQVNFTQGEDVTLTFSNLLSLIQQGNSNLAGARKIIDAAQGNLQMAGLKSNPTIEVELETTVDLSEPFLIAGISQSFPRTNRLALEKQVSATLVEAAVAEVSNVERLLLSEAREQLIEILALRERKVLLEKQADNSQELANFISEAAERGEASILEVPTTVIEMNLLQNQAEQIHIQIELIQAKLKPLLGISSSTNLIIEDSLPPMKLPPMQISLPKNRPDLITKQLQVKAANENILLTQAEESLDYDLGIFAGVGYAVDEPEDKETEGIVGIRFSIPLGNNPKTPGALREARAQRDHLDLTATALTQSITAEVSAAYNEMTQWHKLASRINKNLIPKAQENLVKINAAYQNGQVSLQEVLRAREQELSLKLSYLESRQKFHEANSFYLTSINL